MSLRTRDIFSSLTMSNSSSPLLKYGVVSSQIGRLWRQNFDSQKSLSSHLQVVPGEYIDRGVLRG
jgi:hypothetical protein